MGGAPAHAKSELRGWRTPWYSPKSVVDPAKKSAISSAGAKIVSEYRADQATLAIDDRDRDNASPERSSRDVLLTLVFRTRGQSRSTSSAEAEHMLRGSEDMPLKVSDQRAFNLGPSADARCPGSRRSRARDPGR